MLMKVLLKNRWPHDPPAADFDVPRFESPVVNKPYACSKVSALVKSEL